MEKINLVELLKDCPKGMELDCHLFNGLEFDHTDTRNGNYPIKGTTTSKIYRTSQQHNLVPTGVLEIYTRTGKAC